MKFTRYTVPIVWTNHAQVRVTDRTVYTLDEVEKDLRKHLQKMKYCSHCRSYSVVGEVFTYVIDQFLRVITVYKDQILVKNARSQIHEWRPVPWGELEETWFRMYSLQQKNEAAYKEAATRRYYDEISLQREMSEMRCDSGDIP